MRQLPKSLVTTVGISLIVAFSLFACTQEVIKEVPVDRIIEKEVIKEVPVEKLVEVKVETVKTVEVEKPVEVIKEVVREVRVKGDTIVVEKEVVKTVEIEKPVEVIKEVVKTVEVIKEVEVDKTPVYNEAPMLAKLVAANKLPPVADRLPKDPYVMRSSGREAQIGKYGGTMRRCGRTSDHWSFGYIATEGMVRFDQDARTLLPQIAKSWTASEDNRLWTVKIREGLRWSDGAPFSMDDMMFEYNDVIMNDELLGTKQPSKMKSGGEIVKFEPLDDTTIQFRFKEPFADWPDVMAQLNRARGLEQVLWAPKHYMKQFHIKYNPEANELAKAEGYQSWVELYSAKDDPVMNPDRPSMRAWRLLTRVIDPKMIAERNPYYWAVDPAGNQLPYIDRIEWTTINDREVSFLDVLAGKVDFDRGCGVGLAKYPLLKENETNGNYRVIQSTRPGGGSTVNMNQSYEGPEGKWIRTKNFRLALGLAIDRDAINEIEYLGLAEKMNPMPQPHHPYYPGDEWKFMNTDYDLEKAKSLLDELGLTDQDGDGFRDDTDGGQLHLMMMGTSSGDRSEIIMRGWNEIGLKSTFNVYERSVTYAKSSDNTMMFAGGQISNSPFIFAVPSHTAPVDHKLVNNMGAKYALWHETEGAEGLEPPDDLKNLIRLHVEGAAQPTEELRAKYAQDILKAHAEEQWQIGLVGNAPDIYIASNDLMNVPDTWTAAFINRYYAVTFPEQMWFGPDARRAD